MADDARLKRLPQWAQNQIERLEANVEFWRGRALVGPKESDTFLHYWVGESNH